MAGTHVYLVTNNLNGKQYVGQTIVAGNDIGHGTIMRKAYRKHGKRNFSYGVIKTGIPDRNTLNFMERFWIKTFGSQVPNGYNIENGGSSKGKTAESTKEKLRQIFTGFKHTDEAKRKISEANRNRSPETLAKISASNKGRAVSDETRAKIAETNRGQKRSDETRERVRLAVTGRKASEETKAKMRSRKVSDETRKKLSEAHKGRVVTEATRLKIAEGNRGKVVSDDTKAKIRAANIGKSPSEETKRKLSEVAKRQWAKQKGV